MALYSDTKEIFTKITPGSLALFLLLACLIPFFGCAHTGDKLKEKSGVYYRLGNEYYKDGNIADALKEYTKAVAIYPEEPSYHLMLGFAYSSRELDERAEGEMKKAVELNPMFSEAHIGLAFMYKKAGNWDGVIKECKRALKNIYYKTPEVAYLNMGIAYYEKGDYDASIEKLQKAAALKPGMAEAYYNMGLSLERLKESRRAIALYRKAVKYQKDYPNPYFRLGVLLVKNGEKSEAMSAFEKVVEYAPADSAMAVSARDYLDLLR